MSALLTTFQTTLSDPGVRLALRLTAEVALYVLCLQAVAGVLLGYALSRPGWRGRSLLDIAITLPLVFPPMALGFVLLLLMGREDWLGRWWLAAAGEGFVFTKPAVVLASFIAGLPLVVKPVQAAMETLSARLAEVARTLGKREWEILLFVLLPNVRKALLAGLALGLGRSLGEVGITLMLGGNIVGRTNTLSLEIFNAVSGGDFDRAMVLTVLLGLVSALVFAAMRRAGNPA
ncbi:MAG: molybdate ABC transporter permease subunit [Candidatus Dactylopiibacterium carminicum]|uniref:Molybdate ABC transporter permease subunit n=1 Tax=Candidatus Dactylopiibacterium carminicum TaxID=857335 RepID=A0A272EY19_9RHOO|nr:ABC transporter permease subunit [Candidatus Dactylopiibacterium carminicum]KAF7600403.1 molybdate ABC transporter permease subunit [Candidatus Dactylopiibacterium carminicum]PAS95024.1 MAG: molybdate ABC transporter permease subunit [Candidatus Dactylopiibacterium carminicum]PAT00404.1 MAG: molybdenum ABC transporter permease [Candidatus Dactylopiibacterium carminicum]